jgi:hypothetical protein
VAWPPYVSYVVGSVCLFQHNDGIFVLGDAVLEGPELRNFVFGNLERAVDERAFIDDLRA